MQPADTAWVLVAAGLVLLMIPGLALFYGGLVGRRNASATMLQVFAVMALVTVQWILFGYSLAFGPDRGGLIGDLSWALFRGVGLEPNPDYAATIPHVAFAVFQLMFAAITPALIVGALAERGRTPAVVAFALLWATLVYAPLAHWVWGVGGWLRELGALDFAGGLVVHVSSGVAGLVGAWVLGRRRVAAGQPHNVPLVLLGTGLLWFGWFGFNAGSALAANQLAANAVLVTHVAAAAAALGWAAAERLAAGRVTLVGACTGAVAGLVAITPAAGFVGPRAALVIGAVAGVASYLACTRLKERLGADDALDVFGVHGIAGTTGALLTGVFADPAVNSAATGLLYGNPSQVVVQLISLGVAAAYVAVASWVLYRVADALWGLRAAPAEEAEGLDRTLHGEPAYDDPIPGWAQAAVPAAPAGTRNAVQMGVPAGD